MKNTQNLPDPFFTPFEERVNSVDIPERFTYPFDYRPNLLSLLAVKKLQAYLTSWQDLNHNFGLSKSDGAVIGKMFGVLIVKTEEGQIGYLSAFSGKLGGSNHHKGFVPPIFDGVEKGGFLNRGMLELAGLCTEIKRLESLPVIDHGLQISKLKESRKAFSNALQQQIFEQYSFLNQYGDKRSLRFIFDQADYKNPPAGAGECAAPKLLQYAFQHRMKPVSMAEFWWGLSPKSDTWKHGNFYPACLEKCAPILGHMLSGIALDERTG